MEGLTPASGSTMSKKNPMPSARTLLLCLPPELTQDIAYLLPNDVDIVNLSLSCSSLHKVIMPAESLIWRRLFKDMYDIPQQQNSIELKTEYQTRSIVLAQKISFKRGEGEGQTLWLEVLRDMLLESFESTDPPTSKNIERIQSVLSASEFLDRPSNGYSQHKPDPPSELFCAVQLCLTGMALDQSMFCRCLRTDYDIKAVYSYGVDGPRTLVDSKGIDLIQLLQIRNFWLRHLLNTDEATYSDSYRGLGELQRPRAGGKFGGNSGLPMQWIGYYSCIHPYPSSISILEAEQTCAGTEIHLSPEPMILHIYTDPDYMNWPPVFQEVIPLLGEESNRSYFRGFQSSSGDESINLARGFVETIGTPQGGFSGWRRVCFALYETHHGHQDLQGEDHIEGFIDQAPLFPHQPWPPYGLETDFVWIHGYEGIVLPGGQIMVGQWVDMVDTRARGPYIFWVTESLCR